MATQLQTATSGAIGTLKQKMGNLKQENDALKDENEMQRKIVFEKEEKISNVSNIPLWIQFLQTIFYP